MPSILVAGGAGYIGSHCLKRLREQGYDAFAFDDLSEGHSQAVLDADLVQGNLGDIELVRRTLREREVEAVFHFAAHCYVGESVTDPAKYWDNNVVTTKHLLDAMRAEDCKRFVFSSTCATYGVPETEALDESHQQWPINPYGWTKFVVERMLSDYGHAYGLESTCLRYFNAAGAHPDGAIGEDHDPETHLIPLVLQVALGQREKILVFGDDYDTPDGTCIRDYIHIVDLADAHLAALERMRAGKGSAAFNLGNGTGYSVREVIAVVEKVTGKSIRAEVAPRRAGDPPRLVGDATKAREELAWTPRFGDLETIIRTAWAWHSSHPKGYASLD